MKKRKARRTQSNINWEAIRTAHASGLPLREIARNMKIPEGTVLAKSKRDGWRRQIAEAKALVPIKKSNAINPMQSAAITIAERGRRYIERTADLTEDTLPEIENMTPNERLRAMDAWDRFDKLARRNYGLDDDDAATPGKYCINVEALNVLSMSEVATPHNPDERPSTET